jgi:hypothetical protein
MQKLRKAQRYKFQPQPEIAGDVFSMIENWSQLLPISKFPHFQINPFLKLFDPDMTEFYD